MFDWLGVDARRSKSDLGQVLGCSEALKKFGVLPGRTADCSLPNPSRFFLSVQNWLTKQGGSTTGRLLELELLLLRVSLLTLCDFPPLRHLFADEIAKVLVV